MFVRLYLEPMIFSCILFFVFMSPNFLQSQAIAETLQEQEQELILAKGNEPDPVTTLDPVVGTVTPTPTVFTQVPQRVSAINQTDILRANPAVGLDETLRIIPGVFAERRFGPGDVRISIRGTGQRADMGVRGVRVLIDGIPLTEPDGQTWLEPIDLDAISRVEVLRGPNSALYGNASGGVLNYVLEEGSADNAYAEQRFTFGTYNFFKTRFKMAGAAFNDTLSYMGSYSYVETDGYRTHNTARNQRFIGKLKYTINPESHISLILAYSRPDTDIPGRLTKTQAEIDPRQQELRFIPPSPVNSTRRDKRFRPSLTYWNQFTLNQAISLTGYFGTRKIETCIFCTEKVTEWGTLLQYTNTVPIFGLPNRLILGYDLQDQNTIIKSYFNNRGTRGRIGAFRGQRVTQDGFYLQDEFQLLEQLELIGGLRYSQVRLSTHDNIVHIVDGSNRQNFAEWTRMGGLRLNIATWVQLSLTISESFETPTISEFQSFENANVGVRPWAEPQKSTNYELGVKGRVGNSVWYEFAVYRQRFRDEIIAFMDFSRCTAIPCFRNAEKSNHDGVEVGVTYLPLPGLQIKAAYTYADYRFKKYRVRGVDLSGRRIPGVPEHRLVIDTIYEHSSGLYGGIEWLYQTEYFLNDTNQVTLPRTNDQKNPSYTVTNLIAGYHAAIRANWEIVLFSRLNNLFDANYFTARVNPTDQPAFYPYPGRNVFGGVSLRYNFN